MPNIWIVLIVVLLAALLIKEYLPAYAKERGKNLATREDIEEITRKVESAKAEYSRELERVRRNLKSLVAAYRLNSTRPSSFTDRVFSSREVDESA